MKTVLITGGAGAIGYACVKKFAQAGYNTVLNYNNSSERAADIVNELTKQHYSVVAVKADVSKSDEVNAMFDKIEELFGGVDVLVNNSGISQQCLFTDITDEQWDRMIGVNVSGTFYCSRRALKYMINKKSGKIINISSMWGVAGGSCEVHYSASKAAVIGMTKALAKEVGPSGITVNCVAPGLIDTPMNEHLGREAIEMFTEDTPLERTGTADDVAETVMFLAGNGGNFYTGQVLSPNGGAVI